MTLFLNVIVDGIAFGMILFMISVGLSVTMGLMRVINLAHGGFALLGGVLVHLFAALWGWPFELALPMAVAVTVLVAIPMEAVFYRPLYGRGELTQVLATIGIAFVMIATVNVRFGSTLLEVPLPDWLRGPVDLGFRTLPAHRVAVIVAGLLVLAGLFALIERTRFGIALRASVDNAATASALGIDTSRVFAAAFALGAGLAALGGALGAEMLPIRANYPLEYMVIFLVVVAVGGMGSIAGSFLAAIGLGIVFNAGAQVGDGGYSIILFFAATMVILALRPHGLMGRG